MNGATVWTAVYRAALWCLPGELRRKHGDAMAEMFAAEVESADGAGARFGVAVRGVADVLGRGAYEQVRPLEIAENVLLEDAVMTTTSTMTVAKRVFVPFLAVLFVTTDLLVANFAFRRGASGSVLELVMLAVPFTAAMTIPISMFVALFWMSRRFRLESATPALGWSMVRPVLVISAVVSAFAFVLATGVLPRANARLQTVLAGHAVPPGDRSMSLRELRLASNTARASLANATGIEARDLAERVARFDLEYHKKFAISAAVIALALVGLVLGWHFPHAGVMGTAVATIGVIGVYYVVFMGGESLADQRIVTPSIAIWGANALALLVAVLPMRRRRVVR